MRERETDRQTERDRDRHRETDTDRETETVTERPLIISLTSFELSSCYCDEVGDCDVRSGRDVHSSLYSIGIS